MHDLSGRTIHGYHLREQIGAGGFGAVYRAFQEGLNREVAVKVILPERASQPEFIKRFETEARLVAQLDHLHIVPLFDYWRDDDDTAYLVMRWLRGGSLRALVHTHPLSLAVAVKIIDQICGALAFAHQHGIIHRDIKPDNILLDEDHNGYLSDFGIAKVTLSTAAITSTDSAPGTPAYAAPEQVGGGKVTPQTDLYALGITLYECLIGTHPFPESPLQHLYENLPLVSSQRSDIPYAVDDVIQRATQKRASARYADALAFGAALRSIVQIPQTNPDAKGVSPTGSGAVHTGGDFDTTVSESFRVGAARSPDSYEITPARRSMPHQQSALLIQEVSDVPSRPELLIGRNTLLAEIDGLLNRGSRVLLQGLGGMGKTSLAAEICARRVENGQTPALWLRATGCDPEQWMIALARPFDAHQAVALSKGDAQAKIIRSLLKDRGVKLLVLDDAWDGQALKTLIDALPPGMPAIVTSRQRFPVGKILDVGELDLPQALELLNYHASEYFTTDDAEAVALCKRLGYHPFTLEIAAKTLQVDGLTPGELLTRIGEAPHLMEMPEGYAPAGRSSVKELLNESMVALDADSRDVFLAYGALFVPEATAELLAYATGRTPKYVDDALTTLGRRGLTRKKRVGTVSVYTIHDLAFSYTRSMPSILPADVINACRDYAAAHTQDFDALDAERSNILKAAEAAYTFGDGNAAIAIMRSLTVDGSYLAARGHDALMLTVLEKAIRAARISSDVQAETLHFLLSRRGNAYYNANDLNLAQRDYQEALTIAQALSLSAREVILRCVISKISSDQGDFAEAESELEQAGALAKSSGDDGLIARVLEQRGYHFAQAKHDFASARDVYQEQVSLSERLQHPERLFFALQNLASAEIELGSFDDALHHAQHALDIAHSHDNHTWIAYALFPLGEAYHGLNNHDAAWNAFGECLRLNRHIGNQRMALDVEAYMRQSGYTVPSEEN